MGPSSPGMADSAHVRSFDHCPPDWVSSFSRYSRFTVGTIWLRVVKQLCGTHSPERNRPEHLHGSTNVVGSSCETAHIYAHFQDASIHNTTGTGQQARSR